MMIAAPTGLGKTNFLMAIGFSLAAGRDFLHWKLSPPVRVLFVDGEMSRRLMKVRLSDAARRLGEVPENFFVLCRDDLSDMRPLNTPEGQLFMDQIIEQIADVDLIIFDSVMSLLSGDMKEEGPWQEVLPWIQRLTKRSIGQLWVHHTGHDKSRSYGTSTREWQLDTVALLDPVQRSGTDISFTLKFTKARERTPQNSHDFETVVIELSRDQWSVEDNRATRAVSEKQPSPKGRAFHKALLSALVAVGKVRDESFRNNSVTQTEWENECACRGLVDPKGRPDSMRALISKYRLELVSAGWAACNGNLIWNSRMSA